MAEEKVEPRETSWRQLLPWTELFRGFQVALDLNKLALAAAGILVMAFGWWLLAVLFTAGEAAVQRRTGPAPTSPQQQRRGRRLEAVQTRPRPLEPDARDGRPRRHRARAWTASTSSTATTNTRLYEDAVGSYRTPRPGDPARWRPATTPWPPLKAAQEEPATTPEERAAKETSVADAQKKLGEAETALQSLRLGNLVNLLTDEKLSQAQRRSHSGGEGRALAALYLGDPGPVKPYARLATVALDRGPRAESVPDGDGPARQAVGDRPLLGLVADAADPGPDRADRQAPVAGRLLLQPRRGRLAAHLFPVRAALDRG